MEKHVLIGLSTDKCVMWHSIKSQSFNTENVIGLEDKRYYLQLFNVLILTNISNF